MGTEVCPESKAPDTSRQHGDSQAAILVECYIVRKNGKLPFLLLTVVSVVVSVGGRGPRKRAVGSLKTEQRVSDDKQESVTLVNGSCDKKAYEYAAH